MKTPFIIAEIGINHNGQLDLAKKLIKTAQWCGCDAVKFQKRTVSVVYIGELDKPRDDGNPYGWTTQGEQKHGLELGEAEYDEIDAFCKQLEIPWFASCWDLDAVDFIERYDPPFHKISSAMARRDVFVDKIRKLDKPTFISTAGLSYAAVQELVAPFDIDKTWVMHCVAKYPCPPAEANLMRIWDLFQTHRHVGYSSHCTGIFDGGPALALGAEVFEKHITLDRTMYGSDQKTSVELPGLRQWVENINAAHAAMGPGIDAIPTEEEARNLQKLMYWL
jgi:N-acetylneuraminate synthase